MLRQFATCLTTPVALFDMDRRLIYLNPAAEAVFGVDFVDLGELSLEEALAIAQPKDVNGASMTPDTIPVGIALGQGRPERGTFSVRDPCGRLHWVGTTTIPVQGYGGAFLGAMSIFWRLEDVGGVAGEGADPAPARLSSGQHGAPVAEGAKQRRLGGWQILDRALLSWLRLRVRWGSPPLDVQLANLSENQAASPSGEPQLSPGFAGG